MNPVNVLTKTDEICAAAKRKLRPSTRERELVEQVAEKIRKAVEEECQKSEFAADIRIEGSVAKDTWIKSHVDVDIFMLVSPELTKQELSTICLPLARRALKGHRIVERYAEHPYVEAFVKTGNEELRINVVPCYKVERGNWLSATDRTPYHSRYVRDHLSAERRDDVRLLKAFLGSIGTYGADIKTGGFSGMLAETLVLGFDGFLNVLRNLAEWNETRFLDVEHDYEGRIDEIRKIFSEPLVVIDPIDKGRNLGAAVRAEQLWNFVAASRHFLEAPSTKHFVQPTNKELSTSEYRKLVQRRGSDLLCVSFGRIDAVIDILWSQLYKTQRALTSFLINNDFEVIRSAGWSNEDAVNLILLEVETAHLPSSKKHEGPPVSRARESASFLTRHYGDGRTVSGPWIENQRWVVQKNRQNINAEKLLRSALNSCTTDLGIASLFSKKRVIVLNQKTLEPLIHSNSEFSKFMRFFLCGRPVWYD
jgi:tRNA nucleotidyltransferase (CCA-adding enzyme)